jgi:hypothetical protein
MTDAVAIPATLGLTRLLGTETEPLLLHPAVASLGCRGVGANGKLTISSDHLEWSSGWFARLRGCRSLTIARGDIVSARIQRMAVIRPSPEVVLTLETGSGGVDFLIAIEDGEAIEVALRGKLDE